MPSAVRTTPDMSNGSVRPPRPCFVMVLTSALDDKSVSLACCRSNYRKAVTIATWSRCRRSYGTGVRSGVR